MVSNGFTILRGALSLSRRDDLAAGAAHNFPQPYVVTLEGQ